MFKVKYTTLKHVLGYNKQRFFQCWPADKVILTRLTVAQETTRVLHRNHSALEAYQSAII